MIESVIYFSPILLLLCGIMLIFLGYVSGFGLNTTFRLTKFSLIGSFVLAVIFYNRTPFPAIARADSFSAVFQAVMYIGAFIVLYLSRKWYAGTDKDEHLFCCGLLMSVIAGNLLSSSENLLLTVGSSSLFMMSNYLLFRHADKSKENFASSSLYAVSAIFFFIISLTGMIILYHLNEGNLNYADLSVYFAVHHKNPYIFYLAAAEVLLFVFLLNMSPLNFWYTETAGRIILPVFTCLTLVPIGGCFAGFIRLNVSMLSAQLPRLTLFYEWLGVLALFSGAVGACSAKNVRKIFAYGAVFHLGIVFLVLHSFTPNVINVAVLYIIIYLLEMYGVCAAMYGLKSKGEYLFMLSDFSGAAYRRPYISLMLMLFLFSLLGFPPFLGFAGIFSALNSLAMTNDFYLLALSAGFLMILAYGYLQIVKSLYFENSNIIFDRADRGIYLAICLVFLLMMFMALKPDSWRPDLYLLLEGGF